MPNLQPLDPSEATGRVKELLEGVRREFGRIPNLFQTMARSPAVLESYFGISGALAKGGLPLQLRERIALTVAELNGCEYCLAAHSATGKSVGLKEKELAESRRGKAQDPGTKAALQFARSLVTNRGWATNGELSRLREAGYGDEDILEIVAVVVLNIFTNYVNHIAQTVVDFPRVEALESAVKF